MMDIAARLAAFRRATGEAGGQPTPTVGPTETGEARREGAPTPEDRPAGAVVRGVDVADRPLANPADIPHAVVEHLVERCGSRHGPILVCARPAGHAGECGSAEWPDGRADGVRWSGAEFRGFGPDATFMPPERPADADDHVAIPPSTDAAELVGSFARPTGIGEPLLDAPSGERRTCRSPRCGAPVIWHVSPTTGKGHPLEIEVLRGRLPSPADREPGEVRAVIVASGRSVRIVLDPAGDMLGRESHFAKCPDGPAFRKPR
jgi:hypothetical protein